MRKFAKIIFSLGALLTLASIVGIVISGTSLNMEPESEDWSGELILKDQAPMTFGQELEWTSIYNVFVEEGKEVNVEVEGQTNIDGAYFESCEIYNDCDYYDEDGYIEGFQYIGEIFVENSGYYEIHFTVVDGDDQDTNPYVMIREEKMVGVFGIIGGFVGCCVGIIVFSIGIGMLFLKKEKVELSPKKIIIVGREEQNITPELTNSEQENNEEWWKDDS